ncbi:GNAT family N-acetyltransferase [Leptospira ellisii]|uniref:GNAT family N-acetyltransferase n=1 Tax=Leptospira ellisii TaxID=2023197 RepID=A0A2N0B6L6_9LEPT|nr:GNAT family N-acetyltransferase [Leptospira ellisii]MDV6234786.1 GNAT family N-acetyltransferase [Leptospira ellisii]PJZ92184.1 GNAT family N-acetyltransferase [Leptospira ellisii]PKA02695.1 GNAT family N-acetyltransferase [Leptospira ellisii]
MPKPKTDPLRFQIANLLPEHRESAIELVNQFFRLVNSFGLDGVFKIRPRAATKMVDVYLKLRGTGKVLLLGGFLGQELVSLLIARTEDKPYLEEEKTLFIDLAVTKRGKQKSGFMKPLVLFCESWAKEQGFKSVELRAISENENAVSFWKSMGYDPFYVRFRKLV